MLFACEWCFGAELVASGAAAAGGAFAVGKVWEFIYRVFRKRGKR